MAGLGRVPKSWAAAGLVVAGLVGGCIFPEEPAHTSRVKQEYAWNAPSPAYRKPLAGELGREGSLVV